MTGFYVSNSSGLTFQNLKFSTVGATDSIPFRINNSSNIKFDSLLVQGNQTQATTNGGTSGVYVYNSKGVSITNSTFDWVKDGVKLSGDNGVTISGNYFGNMTGDGVDGGGTSNLTVSNNFFTNFHTLPTIHPDAVQIWTTGYTTASSNINISGNFVIRGSGNSIQGVNVEDEVGNLTYQNVKITNNTIVGGDPNGVYLQDANNSTVSGNQVAGYGDTYSKIDVLKSTATTLSGNSANGYSVTGSVTQSSNVTAAPITDGGAALLKAWLGSNSQFSSKMPAELQTLTAPLSASALTYAADAFDVSAKFDALNGETGLTSITVTDNAPVLLTTGQFLSDAHARSVLANANGTAHHIAIGDSAANLAAHFDALNAATDISSIMVGDFGWVRLSAAQLMNDSHALGLLHAPTGVAPCVVAHDTAANLSAHFDALNTLASKGSVNRAEISDGKALGLTAAQTLNDTAMLKLLSSAKVAVHDTAANLTADLGALAKATDVGSVSVTDGGTVTLDNSAYTADSGLLSKFVGAHTIEITNYNGQANVEAIWAYAASGAKVSQTIDNADGSVNVTAYAGHLTFSDPTSGPETIATGNNTYESFVVKPGAGSETITGYQLSSDTLSFSHTVFQNAAAVMGSATSNSHGDVVLHTGGAQTVTLVGVTVSQLQQYESHFLFY